MLATTSSGAVHAHARRAVAQKAKLVEEPAAALLVGPWRWTGHPGRLSPLYHHARSRMNAV